MCVPIEEMRLNTEMYTNVSRFELGCKLLPQNLKLTRPEVSKLTTEEKSLLSHSFFGGHKIRTD